MGRRFRQPGSGRIGAVRSSAWIWDFSSTESTIAASDLQAVMSPANDATVSSTNSAVENMA